MTGSRVDSKFSYILDISGLAASQVTSTRKWQTTEKQVGIVPMETFGV